MNAGRDSAGGGRTPTCEGRVVDHEIAGESPQPHQHSYLFPAPFFSSTVH